MSDRSDTTIREQHIAEMEAVIVAERTRCEAIRNAAYNLLRYATIHPERADACIVSRERLGALRNVLLGGPEHA